MRIIERDQFDPTSTALFVDPRKETRSIFVDEKGILLGSSSVVESFSKVDGLYVPDRLGYLKNLYDGVTANHQTEHGPLDVAVLQSNDNLESDEATLFFSPLNDGRPLTPPKTVFAYLNSSHTTLDKIKAQPNSWGPLIKLGVGHDFGSTQYPMAHIQVLANEVAALSGAEKRQIIVGDTRPFGRLAEVALGLANSGRVKIGAQRIKRLHLFGAGMGSKALGAALQLLENGHDVASVTLMNLAIGKTNPLELEKKYGGRLKVGEAPPQKPPDGFIPIPEPIVRRETDISGAEPQMWIRQIRAMMHVPTVMGIMGTEMPAAHIEELLRKRVSVTVVNARNESITAQAKRNLPIGSTRFHYGEIFGVEGLKTGMMTNEHAALVAYIAALGIRNCQQDQLKS